MAGFINLLMGGQQENTRRALEATQRQRAQEVSNSIAAGQARSGINPAAHALALTRAQESDRNSSQEMRARMMADARGGDLDSASDIVGGLIGGAGSIASMLIPGAQAASPLIGAAGSSIGKGITQGIGQAAGAESGAGTPGMQETLLSMGQGLPQTPGSLQQALSGAQGQGMGRPSWMAGNPVAGQPTPQSLGEATMATAPQTGTVQGSGFAGPNAPGAPNIVGSQPRTAIQPTQQPQPPQAQPVPGVPPSQVSSQAQGPMSVPLQGGYTQGTDVGVPPGIARDGVQAPLQGTQNVAPSQVPAAGGSAATGLLNLLLGLGSQL